MKNLKLFLKAGIMVFLALLLVLSGCYYIFHFVNQPLTADPNSLFEVEVAMGWYDNYERGEPTDHCFVVQLPEGWFVNDSILVLDTILQQAYFIYSQVLTDSISQNYPATENYQWQVFQLSFDLEAALVKYNSKADYEDSLFFKPIINTDSKNGNFWLDYHLGSSYDIVFGNFNSSSTNHLITIGLPDTILVTNTNDEGPGSLRAAIDSANGETIKFDLEKGSTIVLKSQLDVNKGINIEGPGSKELSVSGDSSCRAFHIHPNKSLFISGLTIENGYVDGEEGGSAILVDSSANLTASELCITQNKDIAYYGGSICCNFQSRVELDNISCSYNSSLGGGCVSSFTANVNLQNSNLSYNSGSALYFQNDGNTNNQITSVTITNNNGTGIYIYGAPPIFDSINRCNIYLNNKDLVANNSYYPVEVYVDTFTVLYPHKYHISPVESFDMHILNGKLDQADADLYVSPEGDNTNTGLTAEEPLKNIGVAYAKMLIDANNPHSIRLLEGTYSPSSNEEQFPITMLDYTGLKGAGPEKTILDSEGHGSVIRISGEFEPTMEGVTITGGSNSGIYCTNSNPYLTDILVTGNSSRNAGGGMRFSQSNPVFENVIVTGNSVISSSNNGYEGGGGIYFNASNPTLNNVNVSGNKLSGNNKRGGGIYFYHSNSVMNNVTIDGNETIGTNASGGGVFCDYSNSIFTNVLFSNNSAPYGHGGGMYCVDSYPLLINSTFTNNSAHLGSGHGGGLACVYDSDPVLINTIMWNDLPDEIMYSPINEENSISISYSNIQGGESGIVAGLHGTVNWLAGNIDQDPVFVLTGAHPFQINDHSPCIDRGITDTTGLNLPELDLARELRFVNERIDMGAYEWNLMVGNEDAFSDEIVTSELNIFPNPVDSDVTLTWNPEGQEPGIVYLYNTSGTCLKGWEFANQQTGKQEITLNLGDLPKGIYFLRLQAGKEIATRKIVKL